MNGKAVPYQEKYSYTPVSVPVNTLHRKKHGIEMVADLGTFSPLRTSLIVDGIWLYVREKNTALNGIWPIQYTDKTEYPYVGFTTGKADREMKVVRRSSPRTSVSSPASPESDWSLPLRGK